ncbi:MAG TPA: glycosyltransferase family 2 protein [Ktedonosporobacter sp.]|nr:glycosyltransferase family 2 protein [Ktedonosporobacter sp.]
MINKSPILTSHILNEHTSCSTQESAVLATKSGTAHLHTGVVRPPENPSALLARRWFYRGWLCVATVVLVMLLLMLQSALDAAPTDPSFWETSVQWAELFWLVPVPMAIALWVGWFLFTAAIERHPLPIAVPVSEAKPVRLVFRFVTRGDNVDVLRDSEQAVHQAFHNYARMAGPYRIEMITERPVNLGQPGEPNYGLTHVCVVPTTYKSEAQSRFKARALAYAQEQQVVEQEDWFIYLDEESTIDEHVVAGIYRFIERCFQAEARASQTGKRGPVGVIGQGAILYQGGHWFFRGADALRTADDLGRFRLQYALGVPLFGVHGSYLVVRGRDDERLSFDVGPSNSITEDTAWALRAWSKGFRFGWVDGYLREQPPQQIMDFVKQRSRWLSGIRLVLLDKQVPLGYRFGLALFTSLWQLAFLPFVIAVLALFVHASPFGWMRLPADFAWATFMLAYVQGLDVLIRHEQPASQAPMKGFQRFSQALMRRVTMLSLVLCCVWYSFLESAATLYSLKPKQGFFVIQKPSLAPVQKPVQPEVSAVTAGAERRERK